MLQILKEHNRYYETLYLGISTALCFALSLFRLFYSDTTQFLFLNWNLFLAFIPWLLTSLVIIRPGLRKRKLVVAGIIALWLLFFPNAPYILTDLFHLRLKSTMPLWFDLVLILSFAWTGLVFGLFSLMDIEKMLSGVLSRFWLILLSVSLLFIGSFGVYVGRYLRWNSWDILTEPFQLLYDIGDRVISPMSHPGTWGMTLFLGIFLNVVYWSFRVIRAR
ncbi:MAG: DUF1361 domain-containing protein [Bacteroidota bacterium]